MIPLLPCIQRDIGRRAGAGASCRRPFRSQPWSPSAGLYAFDPVFVVNAALASVLHAAAGAMQWLITRIEAVEQSEESRSQHLDESRTPIILIGSS